MIFVTVGGQLPFDRLVRCVDEWAGQHPGTNVFGQIGTTQYVPKNISAQAILSPVEFRRVMSEAGAVVAHAGMGTILTAIDMGKPLLVMPRLKKYREHRSEHQMAISRYIAASGYALVAFDERELKEQLDRVEQHHPDRVIDSRAANQLLVRIREFALRDS